MYQDNVKTRLYCIRFRCGFFKHLFYSRILVYIVLLYTKLKLLLSLGRCGSYFIWFSGIFRFLVDVSRDLKLVEFSKILR